MMVYGTKARSGDTLHCTFCETCKHRDACSVPDRELKGWISWGLGCLSWCPMPQAQDESYRI